ncbi:hypothetical protein HRbin04_00640 [archaeon HR04]|nr:hypothetical protein HRbin04_00640 [archaeon HR04]
MEISYRTLVLFIGALAAAIVGIWIGLSPTGVVPTTITEEVVITHTLGDGSCIVDTTDTVLSAKTVKNCNLKEGTKITVSYEKGSSEARIVP